MNNYDIVKKLTGPINPVGQTHADELMYNNLVDLLSTVDRLLLDIHKVSFNSGRVEESIRKAGKKAKQFLIDIVEEYAMEKPGVTKMEASELLETNDAQVWAQEFIKAKEKNGWTLDDIDKSLMIGWFANAMAAQEFVQ